jgi:uncharacterized membrane protein YdjX (TVP38/TMEM64 family)
VRTVKGTASPEPVALPRRAAAFVAALAAVLFAAFALSSHIDAAAVAATASQARTLVVAHPLLSALGFAIVYTSVAALAVPIVWVMNVLTGALFGPWIGLLIAIASSVAGATITMLAARYALRGWVEARFPSIATRLGDGAGGGGARFLFAARLAPMVHFPLVNMAAGLTPMPARTFALVSLAGMLPLSFAYVSAGAELGAIRSPADVLSPGFVGALLALVAAPFAARSLFKSRGRVRA